MQIYAFAHNIQIKGQALVFRCRRDALTPPRGRLGTICRQRTLGSVLRTNSRFG